MINLFTVKEILIHSKNIYLFTKSITIRGNYILTRNYIHFKEPYQFVQGNYPRSMKTYSFREIIFHSTKYVHLRSIYSFKAICSLKETIFIEHCCIRGIAEIFIQNCPQPLYDNCKLYNYHLLRVSVRRQVVCYMTERRTGGNTTDEFNSHTTYAVDLQNSVAYPQQ